MGSQGQNAKNLHLSWRKLETLESVSRGNMQNHYRVGPVYHAGLIVCGGMCAGLGLAVLVASALHREVFAQG